MAELDYAYLADYARVDPTGTVTVVGGSFTQLNLEVLPAGKTLFLVARIRGTVDEPLIPIKVTFEDDLSTGPMLTTNGFVTIGEDAIVYGERFVGHLLTVEMLAPILNEGRYRVSLFVNNELARELFFHAALQS